MFNLFQIDNTEVDHNEDGYTDGLAQDANDEEQVMMIENPQARYYMECSLYKTQPPPTAVVVPCRYEATSICDTAAAEVGALASHAKNTGHLTALELKERPDAAVDLNDVLEVYMHQLWDTIHKYDNSYWFRMDKKKKFDLNLEIFRDIFQIYPRVHGQYFDELPTDEDIVSFFKELGHTREIKSITDVVVDQMHQP
ncbi:hypothetical protein Tco_0154666 [Tanacetum coccineum]